MCIRDRTKQVPEEGQIASLLQNVDYGRISLEGDRLTVPDGMQLDMGAVGKGYACLLYTSRCV